MRVTGVPKRLSNGNYKVQTWMDAYELPSDGSIDEEVIGAFTTGHCHSFALALNELTGWQLVGSAGWGGEPNHTFVRHSNGRYVDVRGFMDEHARARNSIRVTPWILNRECILGFKTYFKARPEFAMPYAKTVLAQVGGLVIARPETYPTSVVGNQLSLY